MNNPAPMMGYSGLAGQQNAVQPAIPSVIGTPGTMHQQLHMQQPHMQNPQQAQNAQVQQPLPPGLVNGGQPIMGLTNSAGAGVANVTSNAGNPLYHPHQGDPALLNNPIWKLQLQLAAVSRQSAGRANVYARQSAMRKYLLNKNQGAAGTLNEMSASLVDHTKQLLLDMAGEPAGSLNNTSSSAASTPITPNAELSNGNPTTPSLLLQHKKLSQYNIDEDDEIEHRMVAPTDTKHDDQLWHALDLSNLQVFNLTESLFKYEFLTRLYLNGNNLTTLPKSVKALTNLRVLDVSHNKLTELPAELGLCHQLKYLYFFDNMVSSLPWEFGNLFNLQFLGLEGNPMDRQIIKILTEKSVTGLIFYLRDNAPEIPLPTERKFIDINIDGEATQECSSLQESDAHQSRETLKKSFTILSYNTLCQHYATPKMYRFTPSWALSWEYRREKLKEQILSYNTDIVCLQEVECKTYEDFWAPLLREKGYSGIFHTKTRARTMHSKDSKKVDGCCFFYKDSEFKLMFKEAVDFSSVWMKHKKFQRTEDYLNRAMNKDNVALVVKLQHIKSGEHVWAATTHLHWDPQFNDVKTFQVGVLLDYMEKVIKEQNNCNNTQELKKVPVVICGDFNSQTNSAVYELLNTGNVSKHRDIEGRDFGYMSQKNYAHNLPLKSSYDSIGELPFTNLTPTFTDVIDYIWYSSQGLRVRGLLGEIDPEYASKFIGFPNDKFPSDHIPLITRFEFTKGGGSRKA
ncbi:CCR4-Not complex 3'-5'-exoribonuclease subunit Ccr4 [Lachancea thermotolerans]|uniref:CCR4-Not complex 3'-5'-exoribonuclease subunit Ccr4 n=1 Tax=Lachancea thermotolerans (strain ATCC 56472 / CBS 6340 / NRRL Y-8284) TaxID=559295 RepID=C5DG45_LACTC|nr:KLTH0D02310p [Lachancea thermotolerans CBS 6340]CAR22387.1 KLTH0D02310p [Lachancea thermotolerans CBS 6340]